MTQFSLNIHENKKGTVVAACDKELIGERFTENGAALHVSESFYSGDDAELEEIIKKAERALTTNFVGEALISALIEEDVLSEEEVHYIDGVPHAQLFFI